MVYLAPKKEEKEEIQVEVNIEDLTQEVRDAYQIDSSNHDYQTVVPITPKQLNYSESEDEYVEELNFDDSSPNKEENTQLIEAKL